MILSKISTEDFPRMFRFVADYLENKDESPLAASDLRKAANIFEALRKENVRLEAENARLRAVRDAETDEFNAGYDACRAGKSLFDDPCGPYDVWGAGFKLAAYDDMELEIAELKAKNARLRAALEQVEFIYSTCEWCGGVEPYHEPDCPRQKALEE